MTKEVIHGHNSVVPRLQFSTSSSSSSSKLLLKDRKIRNMWKRRSGSDWKGSKNPYRERKDKDRSSIICYECKKPRQFKSKYPDLDKTDHKDWKTIVSKILGKVVVLSMETIAQVTECIREGITYQEDL
ncbi:hypothetical protein JHK87_049939 [Glycine soja]|nr:hypothetical protein JHK87_049939 [Glycine soja]